MRLAEFNESNEFNLAKSGSAGKSVRDTKFQNDCDTGYFARGQKLSQRLTFRVNGCQGMDLKISLSNKC